MSTFFMIGKYSADALKKISAERTEKAIALVKEHGGELKSGYALLGENDLILIVDLPNPEQAIKTSVALTKMLDIAFNTASAITMEEFDKITG